MKALTVDWDAGFLQRSPAFHVLRPACEGLDLADWPSPAALTARAADLPLPPRNSAGQSIVFAESRIPAALAYEQHTFDTGMVACRTRDWHDFMNALAWMTFPRTKAALNARHMAAGADEIHGQRGRVRDALTVFDEGGAIVLSCDGTLLEDLRHFRWKRLFWERRESFTRSIAVLIVGHALNHKLLAPYIGLTAKAILIEVSATALDGGMQGLVRHADERAAAIVADASRLHSPQEFAPLPILGVPGWYAANEDPAFYDDISYFRPGRRRQESDPQG